MDPTTYPRELIVNHFLSQISLTLSRLKKTYHWRWRCWHATNWRCFLDTSASLFDDRCHVFYMVVTIRVVSCVKTGIKNKISKTFNNLKLNYFVFSCYKIHFLMKKKKLLESKLLFFISYTNRFLIHFCTHAISRSN